MVKLRKISVVAAICAASLLHAQAKVQNTSGIAWKVKGTWYVEGSRKPVLTGDPILPGTLLKPTVENAPHSITVLLPDGQAILEECFIAKACARGFRIPALFGHPDPFAADMLARIRAVLASERGQAQAESADPSRVAQDETIAVLDAGNRIEIGGVASRLANGQYFGDLVSVGGRYARRSGIPLQKSGHSIGLAVPGPGLYLLTITDAMKWPRIEFMIAVETAPGGSVANAFHEQHALLAKWIDNFFGWPMHDFQRAYLESLMLDIKPRQDRNLPAVIENPQPAGVTAEPTFSPHPGMVGGDIAIDLHCATPGASIHYSVDTSQPLETSSVYRAPIVMTKLPLTIKAFAHSPGKKDSPVVTANFRVEQ